MGNETIKGVIRVMRSPYLSLVFSTIGIVVLFAPDDVAEKFGFKQVLSNHIVIANIPARTIIGFGTLVVLTSFAYLSVMACWNWNARRLEKNATLKQLDSLSIDERKILGYCFVQGQQTIALEVTHPAANALASKGLLYRGTVVNILAVPFTVPNEVWERIKAKPSILFGGEDPYGPTVAAALAELHRHINRHNW